MKLNLREYLMEAAELGLFMLSASTFAILLQHPASPLRFDTSHQVLQRFLMGLAMGITAAGIIYSPLGKRSGAHFNPSVTITYWRLGRVATRDAAFYVLAQFIGGISGIGLAKILYRGLLSHPSVNTVATLPGSGGWLPAFTGELGISLILILVVLKSSDSCRLKPFTGLIASALVVAFITVEAPLSGMSMNPARTVGSALGAGNLDYLWIYFLAPPLGMLLAAEAYLRLPRSGQAGCAKLHHEENYHCIFCGNSPNPA